MGKDYLREIADYNVRPALPRPGKCALLVIDMQKYFLSIASPIIKNVLSIIEACRTRNIRVIFTRHGHRKGKKDGGMLYDWWGDAIRYGTDEWQIINSLFPAESEDILDKSRYSAFCDTNLDARLKKWNIEELIIAGVMTNCCCETTARGGFDRD